MIYTYKYLPHKIEGLHQRLCFFFEQLFNHDLAGYDENILLEAEFITIIKNSRKLVTYLTDITESYHLLPTKDKETVKTAYLINNKIDILCSDLSCDAPVKYEQIDDEKFRKLLKDFFNTLWDDYPIINAIEENFGLVQDHFNAFVDPDHQQALVCPFCGLMPLLPSGGNGRNDYDHFLPQKHYPFIAVNFKNLFPICDHCNSKEKKAEDTLYKGTVRRTVLYPCDASYEKEKLNLVIEPKENYNSENLKTLLSEIEWEYAIRLAGETDLRLLAWDEIFRIKERYREFVKIHQRPWLESFLLKKYRDAVRKGEPFLQYKEDILDDAKSQIYECPLGLLRFVYFNFIFSIPDIELKLKKTSMIIN